MVERLRASFIRLLSARPDVAREALGALCESPSEDVVPGSAEEVWVTKDGRRLRIGEMAPEHLAHTLALIIRSSRKGAVWYYRRGDGAMRCRLARTKEKRTCEELPLYS